MKQIILEHYGRPIAADGPCVGRLVTLGAVYGLAMLFVWQLAGPTPIGHALVWVLAAFAGLKLWRAAEGA
jgi:hypothetical protein